MQERSKDSRIWSFLRLRKSPDPGRTIPTSWNRDSSHPDDDGTPSEPPERGRSRSRGKHARAKSEGRAMNPVLHQRSQSGSPHSDGGNRGRTPSPKRAPAPMPPTPGRSPSPAPKLVSMSEVLPSDQQGWLTDQLRGRRVWCAVADMLFCVFENEDAKVSKQVLLLPGCKVRQVEFKTASRDNSFINGLGRRFRSKTLSGVDKFQFWIENSTNRQRLMFGVDTKAKLEQWMEVLTRVASADPDKISPDDSAGRDQNNKDGSSKGGGVNSETLHGSPRHKGNGENGETDREYSTHARLSPRSSSSSDVTTSHGDDLLKSSSYSLSQTLPRRIDFLSMSLSNTGDVGRGSVDDIKKRLRREPEHQQDAKMTPLKATYADSDASSTNTSSGALPGRRRSFFRVGAFESLFKATKRSASADDAKRRKSVKNPSPQDSTSSPSSPEQARRSKPHLARSGSEGVMLPDGGLEKPEGGKAFLSRSWDGEKGSRGLGASIRRSASDLKSRLFSSASKSRGPGLCLGDLTDSRLDGFLQYKAKLKWVRIWAVLCRGCFYGFRSDKKTEVPLLVFVLPQCAVQYVQQTEKRLKRLLAFKLTQPHCRSLNLCAENHQDLMKWLQALQMEVCKVVAEDDDSNADTDNTSNNSVESSNLKPSGSTQNFRTLQGSTFSAESTINYETTLKSGSVHWGVETTQNSRSVNGSTAEQNPRSINGSASNGESVHASRSEVHNSRSTHKRSPSSGGNVRKVSNSSSGFVSSSSTCSLQGQDSVETHTPTPPHNSIASSTRQYYSEPSEESLVSTSFAMHSPDAVKSARDFSQESSLSKTPEERCYIDRASVVNLKQSPRTWLQVRNASLDQGFISDQSSYSGVEELVLEDGHDLSPPEAFRDDETFPQRHLPDFLQEDEPGSLDYNSLDLNSLEPSSLDLNSLEPSSLDYNSLELGSFHSDSSSIASSSSQPNTPRHDDALTQVWGRDRGYVLQLIRNKLEWRKRKAFSSLVEGETIYNKELEGTHEGGLLIEHGDDTPQDAIGSSQEVLPGDSRHRSKSFTEGKTTKAPPPPSGIPQLPLPPQGWRSNPAIPRDAQRDVRVDITRRHHHNPRQREVVQLGDAEVCEPPSGEFSDLSGDVYHNDGSSPTSKEGAEVANQHRHTNRSYDGQERVIFLSEPNGNHTASRHTQVTSSSYVTSSNEDHVTSLSTSRYGFRYNSGSLARDENRNGDSDVHPDEALGEGGVYLPVERDRSYSAAWDEDDDEDSTPKQADSHGRDQDSHNKTVNNENRVNVYDAPHASSGQHQASPAQSQCERAQTISRGRPRQLPVRSQSNPKEPSLTSPHTPTRTLQDASQASLHSPLKASHLPVPGQSSGIPQRSRDPARQLRRSPRAFDGGPVNPRDSAPAQLADTSSLSSGPPQSSRAFGSLQSPRGLTEGPRGPIANANPATRGLSPSTTHKARSLSAGPSQSPRRSPTVSAHPGSSTAIPQSPRAPAPAIPQSSRGTAQGPPQSPRGSVPAIPQSPRGPPPQSPRRLASGPPPHTPSGTPRQGREGVLEGSKSGGSRPPPMAVMQLAARDLQSSAMHGYLQRKTFNDQWLRYWYVLQDGCLYCYLTPDDRVTVDVTDLEGYTVTLLEDNIPGQRFVIHLDHEHYIPVYLSASSREDMEEWHAALTSALKATPRTNGLDPQGACGGRVSEERVLSIKQKLLAEVLRQKQELEKKQAARLAYRKQLSQDDSEIGFPPTTPKTKTGEQICTLTRLRQRRMSTQIKMDTLQRQINTNGHKKSRFTFGKKKSGEEAPPRHNPDVMEQLKTLSDHLSEIDRDLLQNGGAMTLDRAHARRKAQLQGLRHSYDMESPPLPVGPPQKTWSSSDRKSDDGVRLPLSPPPRANGVESMVSDDSGMARSNSLKSSMQKLANRTFARAGWRGKKSSQSESADKDSNDSDEPPRSTSARTSGSQDHVTGDAPDFIDLSNRLARTWPARDPCTDSAGDEQVLGSETLTFLPPPSSFNGDDSSPVSSPRSARSTGSMTSRTSDQGHHHSNASHPDDQQPVYPPKSPRRQVDPGAMANIEAFEELSRQILGEKAS